MKQDLENITNKIEILLDRNQRSITNLQNQISHIQQRGEALLANKQKIESDIPRINNILTLKTTEIQNLEAEIAQLKTSAARKGIREKEASLTKIQKEIQTLEEKLATLMEQKLNAPTHLTPNEIAEMRTIQNNLETLQIKSKRLLSIKTHLENYKEAFIKSRRYKEILEHINSNPPKPSFNRSTPFKKRVIFLTAILVPYFYFTFVCLNPNARSDIFGDYNNDNPAPATPSAYVIEGVLINYFMRAFSKLYNKDLLDYASKLNTFVKKNVKMFNTEIIFPLIEFVFLDGISYNIGKYTGLTNVVELILKPFVLINTMRSFNISIFNVIKEDVDKIKKDLRDENPNITSDLENSEQDMENCQKNLHQEVINFPNLRETLEEIIKEINQNQWEPVSEETRRILLPELPIAAAFNEAAASGTGLSRSFSRDERRTLSLVI